MPFRPALPALLSALIFLALGCKDSASDAATDSGGADDSGVVDPTAHWQYKSFTIGAANACALTWDGEILCWGYNNKGQADPPDGVWSSVECWGDGCCALDMDGIPTCWGDNTYGQADAPTQPLLKVAPGYERSCGLALTGEAVCWGSGDFGEGPNNVYEQIDVDFNNVCGLTPGGVALCWGDVKEINSPSKGDFRSIGVAFEYACGIEANGEALCWGKSTVFAPPPYDEVFVPETLSVSGRSSAAITTDGRVRFFGSIDNDLKYDPTGSRYPGYEFVSVAHTAFCGFKTTGELNCEGWNETEWGPAPDGAVD
jgi:alpha-tubulin suppressor-like RCC1 family protein